MHLERRHPRQRALRRPDLGREVRERRQIIAERRRLLGEPVTRQLHPITGITREPDDHPIELLDLLGHAKRLLLLGVPPGGGRVQWAGASRCGTILEPK
jgi:hypothetical protein